MNIRKRLETKRTDLVQVYLIVFLEPAFERLLKSKREYHQSRVIRKAEDSVSISAGKKSNVVGPYNGSSLDRKAQAGSVHRMSSSVYLYMDRSVHVPLPDISASSENRRSHSSRYS